MWVLGPKLRFSYLYSKFLTHWNITKDQNHYCFYVIHKDIIWREYVQHNIYFIKMSLYNTVPFTMIYTIKFKSIKYTESWCMALQNVIWYKCYLKLPLSTHTEMLERRKCTTNVPSIKWKVYSHWNLLGCRQSPFLHPKGRERSKNIQGRKKILQPDECKCK